MDCKIGYLTGNGRRLAVTGSMLADRSNRLKSWHFTGTGCNPSLTGSKHGDLTGRLRQRHCIGNSNRLASTGSYLTDCSLNKGSLVLVKG